MKHKPQIKRCECRHYYYYYTSIRPIRRHRSKPFRLLSTDIDVTVAWSVCLSVTFVHCAQTAEDIDTIFCARQLCLSLIALNLTYIGKHLPRQILPQSDPLLVDLSVGDIRWQIAAECNGQNRQPIGNYHHSSNGTIADSLPPPLPPKRRSQMHPGTNFATLVAGCK